MHLFTSDSDKKFLYVFFATMAVVAVIFYFYVEQQSELMARQKMDGRYFDFTERYIHEEFELVTLGSSHAETAGLMGVASYPLSAPFSLPTVMYIKAKLITKAHPEVKAVYMEADDHLLFKGPVYDISKLNPQEKRQSKVFEWGGAFIDSDDEARHIFGEVAPSSQSHLLLLKEDIKPIILKRIFYNIVKQDRQPAKTYSSRTSNADCSLASYPTQLDLTQDSHWSTTSTSEQDRQSNVVIAQHGLDLPDPLDSTQTFYFEKTIQHLKNHHIDVVLVQYPEAPGFIAKKNPKGQEQYEIFIRSMVEKYQLRTVDTRSYAKYGDKLFDDHDHIDGRYGYLIGRQIMEDFCTNVAQKTIASP